MVVVLTGGIASGKSVVADLFFQKGVSVIDTDVIAKELVNLGQPALAQISKIFGRSYLKSNGELNRAKLRTLIYRDKSARRTLENLLHPLIELEVLKQVDLINTPYCILVIPLFTETTSYSWIDRVLVVDTPEEVQINRVQARDNIDLEQANAIIAAQANRKHRLRLADDIIQNCYDLAYLKNEVDKLHKKYLNLAAKSIVGNG